MNNTRLSIKYRIFGGFIFMVIAFIIVAIISFYNADKNNFIVKDASENKRPSSKSIYDLKHLATRSKMLITNWVYLQGNNDEDKEALKYLIEIEYPTLKENITKLKENWEDSSLNKSVDTVLFTFDKMIGIEQGIMEQLVDFEDYEDPFTKLMAEDAVTTEILPLTTFMNEQLAIAESIQDRITTSADQDQIKVGASMKTTTIIAGIIIVVFGLTMAYFMSISITNPINFIKEMVVKMGLGELPEDQDKNFKNDEIGEMAKAMDNLINGLKSTTVFAENIGNGNYESEYKPLSDNDVLGNALIEMRSNLRNVAEEDKKRSWATEGQALFGEILRSNNSDIDKLADDIIRNLIKYLNANQAGLFVINSSDDDEPFMELLSCYAWDKKKYLDQKIYKGDGLVGQCWQEMDKVYITDVPDGYVNITSGLGDANPTSILIMPLKVNDEIHGVVEMASFTEFKVHEIEFVEKIAESIASTISTVRVNAKTQSLLEESQQMTEEMRAQEEEMRQNMEELQATQEEVERSTGEYKSQSLVMNETRMIVSKTDKKGIITYVNDKFCEIAKYSREELLGKSHNIVRHPDMTKAAFKNLWDTIQRGDIWKGYVKNRCKDGDFYWVDATIMPVKGRDGAIEGYIGARYDLTEFVNDKELVEAVKKAFPDTV
ncbi:MAG: PAS domain-containing protein [Cyclobacteriaceae bacterium]|nr:PAS domain-containing protein [Cyclobacteriaceae bacterium]